MALDSVAAEQIPVVDDPLDLKPLKLYTEADVADLKAALTKVAERIKRVPNVDDYDDVPHDTLVEMDDALNDIAITVDAARGEASR